MNTETKLRVADQAEVAVDWLATARALAPLIERESVLVEAQGMVTPGVRQALFDSGLFWIMVSKDLGGGGESMSTIIRVVEELTRADGSTGWAYMTTALETGLAAGFLGPDGHADLFTAESKAILCGQLLPTGRATRVEGGYRLTGRFAFASGFDHASWVGAGFTVCDGEGNPILGADGEPQVRVGMTEKRNVENLGNWDVSGLRGTGSYDYAFHDVFIPERHAFDTFSFTPTKPDPVYRMGILSIAVSGHAGVALGVMKRALQEIVTIALSKGRPGYPTVVGDSAIFKREFTRHEAQFQAARSFVYQVFADVDASLNEHGKLSPEDEARIRQSTTWVHEVALQVVGFAHRWGGSQSIRNQAALGRCSRDVAVMTQHLMVDELSLVDAAGPIMATYQIDKN